MQIFYVVCLYVLHMFATVLFFLVSATFCCKEKSMVSFFIYKILGIYFYTISLLALKNKEKSRIRMQIFFSFLRFSKWRNVCCCKTFLVTLIFSSPFYQNPFCDTYSCTNFFSFKIDLHKCMYYWKIHIIS